jgi:hypothetical protein
MPKSYAPSICNAPRAQLTHRLSVERYPRRVIRRRATVVVLLAIICAIFAASWSVALARPSDARITTACPNLTVYAGKVVGTVNLRFELIGAVSCQEARRLIAEFFKRAVAGRCEGTACLVQLPKGWSCSYFFATESKETGGALAGCAQAAAGAKIRVYKASAAPASAPKRRVEAAEFFVRYPHDRAVTCAMYDGRSGVQTLCETERPNYEQKATLEPSGIVHACSAHSRALTNACDLGNAGEGTPTYRPGKQITVGRFRCRVLSSGVQCTLTAKGRGFLFTPTNILPVGGATIRKGPTSST